ncbi:MAG: hypothetical protein QOG67_1672 [Verrucomicrobiota bacterium]
MIQNRVSRALFHRRIDDEACRRINAHDRDATAGDVVTTSFVGIFGPWSNDRDCWSDSAWNPSPGRKARAADGTDCRSPNDFPNRRNINEVRSARCVRLSLRLNFRRLRNRFRAGGLEINLSEWSGKGNSREIMMVRCEEDGGEIYCDCRGKCGKQLNVRNRPIS